MSDRLAAQFAFLNEADRLKSVNRANVLMNGARAENTAEHSWHLALWALVMGAPEGVDLDRVIALLLLHDLPEIDAGDHPIHLVHNPAEVARAEARGAARIFGLLPGDLAAGFSALWHEFEAGQTPEAQLARRFDHAQPLFQVLMAEDPRPDHLQIVRDNLTQGRAARFANEWSAVFKFADALLHGQPTPSDTDLHARLSFLAEADRLKSVCRATTLVDGSRPENSAEHSWHLALYALTLASEAGVGVNIARVIRMLILHDLVEIDVGDVPIHSANGLAHASVETIAAETRAADRLFGLLPADTGPGLRALWDEFEAAQTPDAVFAKSLDRVQPVMANLMSGGGTWITYQVTAEQLETRVGSKIARGAPGLWAWVRVQTRHYFG